MSSRSLRSFHLLPLATLFAAACSPSGSHNAPVVCTQPGDIDCSSDVSGKGDKSDRWNSVNDPSRFAQNLVYRFDELPESGRAERSPWASTYWPSYEDSTNIRWQGSEELSPLEKYDLAFNSWKLPEHFMDLRPMSGCGSEYDKAYYDGLGPAAKWMSKQHGNERMRDGVDSDEDMKVDECEEDYDGIETWWGLCHAWVPAAILETEPNHGVTHNGVRFEVSDMTALLITAYDRSNAMMLGGRCNAMEIERDPMTNRVSQEECRDTNAGAFHVIVSNLLGLRKQAFAEDRVEGYEVWNQPVVGYEVTSKREVTVQEANEMLGLAASSDAGASTSDAGTTTSETYSPNPSAVKLIAIEATVDYITESGASTEPTTPNIDQYINTDYYEYVLELDADDKIVGGEWVNDSHPDFLWLPTGAGYGANPDVDLAAVQNLVREANAAGDSDPSDGGDADDGGAPPSMCESTRRDSNGTCRDAQGRYAPAVCCL